MVDSGASATTLPRSLLGERASLKAPVGYHSFRLADGSMVENEGTLEAKAWLMDDEVLELKASVAAISQALLSVGQVTSRGNRGRFGTQGQLPRDHHGEEAQDLPQERCLHPRGVDGHQQQPV